MVPATHKPRKPPRHRGKPLPQRIKAQVSIVRPGGWTQGGLLASTYQDNVDSEFLVITARHLYSPTMGRDIYPTPEQMDQILAGQRVVIALDQWA